MPNNYESFVAGGGGFSTAQGSVSGTLGAGSSINIALNLKSFFPNIWSDGGSTMRVAANTASQGDYVGRFRHYNGDSVTRNYQSTWEYVV